MVRLTALILLISALASACSQDPVYSLEATGLQSHPTRDEPDHDLGFRCDTDGNELADGVWFGFVRNLSLRAVTVDVACYWAGDGAAALAVFEGHDPVLFYLGNDDPETFDVPLDAAGVAHWVDDAEEATPEPIPMSQWPVAGSTFSRECPGDLCGIWLYINDGVATEIVEWYLPRWESWNETLALPPWD